ncbi:hypothetical protein COLO4_07836 [Corchorus olitorius]|uniref:Terpene synthase metal-binding domain-containing protein n=1 Tax=Corchorus olitorius TaxID=93759 RepID=A0A1R3KIF5_9ROSI|nr:hypothetical protein COLO4_07836 [Corchorus olitorius]
MPSGTPQELQSFIDTLRRWEIGVVDELQDYTNVICKAVLEVFIKLENEAKKEGKSFAVPYLRDNFIRILDNYHAEVKWCHKGHVPTYEEYMSVARKTSTFEQLIAMSFLGMRTVTGIEAFEWLKANPRILIAADLIGRMMDDIVSHEFEQMREHCPSSVGCYMKEHNLSDKETLEKFEKKLEDAWKDINEECMRPTTIDRDILMRPLNIARVSYLFYKHGDGYTHPTCIKDDIHALFIDPVPI